jgi:hypothetical protein
MKVFKLTCDGDKFKNLEIDRRGYASDTEYKAAFEDLRFGGIEKSDWKPPKMHFGNPLKRDPDFWMVGIASGSFAVGPRALKLVYSFLEMSGEVLPLPVKGLELSVLNVLQVYDCIDPDRSEWRTIPNSNERGGLLKPFFVPENMKQSTLFKFPEWRHKVFCWEEDRDPETEFKACVEKNKLKGLEFELVWSDEE